ncbi:MAG: glycosyltransferase family 2 protein, partial [Clostridia bacterium]|nr:glycosyltransferase family 2 protein [Clostridia bacterium]
MKLLTCVIPCYNSAAYVEQAVSSLLPGGEEMDILIVDDGSTDETGAIADRLAARYPGLVRVHHQANGGHGSALNFGIRDALGMFFKVLDSDDMLDPAYLPGLLDLLRGLAEKDTPDLVIHDYVYSSDGFKSDFRISYRGVIPAGRVIFWDQTHRFHIWNQFMIHCLIYR